MPTRLRKLYMRFMKGSVVHTPVDITYVRKCHKCQIYANKIHVLPTALNIMVSPWPFLMWGMDVIEPITPNASNDHRFIFVVIDYFTKWVEAASYASVTKSVVA